MCFKSKSYDSSIKQYFFGYEPLCQKCRNHLRVFNKTILLNGIKIHAFYLYDEAFSKLLIQYKELMDEALYEVFLYPYIKKIKKKYRNCIFVEVPSSESQYEKRGFHHVRKMFSICEIEIVSVFKKSEFIQKEKSLKERKNVALSITLNEEVDFKEKTVVLIDDVCTTSETLNSCVNLLKSQVKDIQAIVVAIHPLLVSSKMKKI